MRVEPMIMLLENQKVRYEIKYHSFDEWKMVKPSMPNGEVPVLELKDGTKMGESKAIMRYLGAQYGLYPSDPMQAYMIDSLLDGYDDFNEAVVKCQQAVF